MNFFACCKQVPSGSGFEVTQRINNKKSQTTFFKRSTDISKDLLVSSNTSIIKIQKSDYDIIAKQFSKGNKKWTDFSFPPNDQSLGVLKDISSNKWKRISDIVQNPVILKNPINPSDVIQSEHGDRAFLATVASLAERPQRIQDLFGCQVYNPSGFYKILLRSKSQIHEVLIDDFVPVNQDGFPLFSKPHQNQIWVMLLEKARAKIQGSYANLLNNSTTPKQIFEQIDFAPTQHIKVSQPTDQAQVFKLWRSIFDNSQGNRPIVAKAGSRPDINWNVLNISANHHYSVIDSASLKNLLGKQERVLKLRNAYGQTQWKGTGHQNDKVFWDQIQQSQNKDRFFATNQQRKDGIFFILFSDFLKYFTDVYINFYERNGSYLTEDLFFNLKNGLVNEIEVYNEGFYTISVDQELQNHDDGWARTTIVIIKKTNQNFNYNYEFIDGILSINQPSALLKTHLIPGTYLAYTKVEPTPQKKYFPRNSHLVIYSANNIKLTPSTQQKNSDFLKKTFLNYGRTHKRQLYNDDLMWMSWKLLNQGGYGYLAFGNDRDSRQKFVITFNQQDFNQKGFKLKKPFKNKGSGQVIEVLPGQEQIILVRVANTKNRNLKFPPKLSMNIVPYVVKLENQPPQENKVDAQIIQQVKK